MEASRQIPRVITSPRFYGKHKKIETCNVLWEKEKKLRKEFVLKKIETDLEAMQSLEGDGYESLGKKDKLIKMEAERRKILKDSEDQWRLKSRAIWLEAGDENSKFFQNYAKGRKNSNKICIIKKNDGGVKKTFEELTSLGCSHFKYLFKALKEASNV